MVQMGSGLFCWHFLFSPQNSTDRSKVHPQMIGNLPLSVSMLHDCLGHPLISFPFISKHLCAKKVSEIRSVHKSLALHYVRDMFSPFHIVNQTLYEITLPQNTLRPHTLPDGFSPNAIPYKFSIASLRPSPFRTELA